MARGLALNAARRARVLRQTPTWSDLDAIALIYLERERATAETGAEYHVDHIVPLRGALVSGLHVAENLRVVRAEVNRHKSNQFKPGEFQCSI